MVNVTIYGIHGSYGYGIHTDPSWEMKIPRKKNPTVTGDDLRRWIRWSQAPAGRKSGRQDQADGWAPVAWLDDGVPNHGEHADPTKKNDMLMGFEADFLIAKLVNITPISPWFMILIPYNYSSSGLYEATSRVFTCFHHLKWGWTTWSGKKLEEITKNSCHPMIHEWWWTCGCSFS